MIALNYIDPAIPFLKDTDSVNKGLDWMDEYKLRHLPVVSTESNALLGIVSEDILLNQNFGELSIQDIPYIECQAFLESEELILEALEQVKDLDVDIIPVLKDEVYQGVITEKTLLKAITDLCVSSQPIYGFIGFKIALIDYSLNEISRIVESNGAKVLNSFVNEIQSTPGFVEVLLKINNEDLSSIAAEFKQMNYQVIYLKSSHDVNDNSVDNYNNLIKYLDI